MGGGTATDDIRVLYKGKFVPLHTIGRGEYNIVDFDLNDPQPYFVNGTGHDLYERIIQLRKDNPRVWDGYNIILIDRAERTARLTRRDK